jgi:hypothetical protein
VRYPLRDIPESLMDFRIHHNGEAGNLRNGILEQLNALAG